ncbi:hypothetical protein Pmani_016141 [Petrolisthes manimaculis]|uniref:FAD/NAD(P)-binding domain-containing protein n=1 Tax=Petrolisthes manimaculis TaxID=1843537 RepID=A0AAE1UAW8_9EUCA|nr:hypothetical protein Pmani_016141 [Petrolisthes manimaculis]
MKEKSIEKEEEEERTETSKTTTKQDNKHEPEKLKLQDANSEQEQINSKGKGSGKTRVFKNDWLKVFPWAFVKGNHTFCRPCLMTGQKNVFTSGKPVSFRPKKDDFKKHESISNHKDALQALANSSSLASIVGASSSPPSDISLVCLPSLPDTSTSSTTTSSSSQTSSISPPISFLTPSSKTHNYLSPSTTLVSSSSVKAASGNTTSPRASSSSSLVTPFIIPTGTPIPRGVSPSLQTSIPSSSVVSQSYIPSFAILKTSATQTLSQRHPHSTTFIVASSTGQQNPATVGSSRVMATVEPLVASGMPSGGAPRKECTSGAGSRVINPPRTVILLKPLVDPKRTQDSTLHKNKEDNTCDKTTASQGQGKEYGMPCMDIVKMEIEEHEEAEERIGVRGKNRDPVKDRAEVYPFTTTTTGAGAAGTNTLRPKKQRKKPLNNKQDQQQQQPLLSSVAELCNRLLATEKGDEFHQFGLNVAAQLRAMPLRASLKAQLKIQETLTAKRFQSMKRRNTHTHTHTQRPKTLAVFERAGSGVTDKVTLFRSVADFQQLHEVAGKGGHITIIGGGFLGSELACALGYKTKSTKGSVTQVYPEYGNMAKVLPEYLSRWTTDKVKSEGVDIITHSTVNSDYILFYLI